MRTNDLWTTYKADTEEQILEAAERIMLKRLTRLGNLSDPTAAANYIRSRIGHLEHEVFGCVMLDTRHQIIEIKDFFTGTIDGAEVHPREVVKHALSNNAAAMIIYHNHPSGSLEWSSADRAVTKQLKDALRMVDVRLIDHILVSNAGTTSMASKGWI